MHAIGIDIGGTKIAGALVSERGEILAELRSPTPAGDPTAIVDAVADMIGELASGEEVRAAGVAAAGFIDLEQSTVYYAPNINWRNEPFRARVAERVDLDITIDNDANAAGWAEFRFGVGRDVGDMLLLTVGTGLGGAIVVEDRLVRGAWGVASEVGHMRVVPDGHLCGCGQRGCWEQYASGSALVREARAVAASQPARAVRLLELAGGDPAAITGPMVTAAAHEGDALATALLAEVGRWVGAGSATVAALLDPELVVIGGGVADAGDLLLEPAHAAFLAHLSGRGFRPEARFALASAGNDAGIVGAADLARR